MRNTTVLAQPVSFSLYKDNRLVAGDIGIQIGRTYTSYSGYHDESSTGMVQLILMSQYLDKEGFAFLDFGPPSGFEYKTYLGASIMDYTEFKNFFADGISMRCKSIV